MNSVLIISGDLDTNMHREKICEDTGRMSCKDEGSDRVMHLKPESTKDGQQTTITNKKHGRDSPSQPSTGTNPADTCISDL